MFIFRFPQPLWQAPDAPGAGSAAPASASAADTPAPAEATPATPEASDADVEFQGLGADFDEPFSVEEEPPATEAAPAADAPPAAPPAQGAPTAASPAPAAPVAPPADKPGSQEPAQASAADAPPAEPADLGGLIEQHAAQVVDELSKTRFALSQDEQKRLSQGLETDATKTILEEMPRLAARVYMESQKATLAHIQRFVPQMVVRITQALRDQQQQEELFFKAFPALNREKHWSDVVAFSQLAKSANPKHTAETLRSFVGAAIMAKYGLTAQPAAPAAPRTNGLAPFVPAQAGTSTRVEPLNESPFEGLGGDHD